jgi:galactokinase
VNSITVRSPGRVNLIGDHTDYTGGLVFPMAIDRWTEISGEPADRIRLVSDQESVPVDLPVTGGNGVGWGRYVAAVAEEVGAGAGIDGRVTSTIPVGAGLSSSASLELAVALALGFEGTPLELAQLGRRAEHRATGVPTGIMDQLVIAAATEGHAAMIDCHALTVEHVPILGDVDIVVTFVAHRTLEGSPYADRVAECAAAEGIIGPLRLAEVPVVEEIDDEVVRRRARHVISENQRVREFAVALRAGDLVEAGRLMVEGHNSIRDDFGTSIPVMDEAVEKALSVDGVYGSRMTGGGFGGCIVSLCAPGTQLDGWRVSAVAGAHRLPAG